jgi:hypothetical protein
LDGRRIGAKQREYIERLRELGCFTLDAEDTLEVYLSTLQVSRARADVAIRLLQNQLLT